MPDFRRQAIAVALIAMPVGAALAQSPPFFELIEKALKDHRVLTGPLLPKATPVRPGTRAPASELPSATFAAAQPDATRFPKPRPARATDAATTPAAAPGVEQASPGKFAAPLPRPRPSLEPATEVTAWADEAVAHFEATAATGTFLPVSDGAGRAIESLAPLPRPRPAGAGPDLALVMPPAVGPQGGGLVAPEDLGCVERLRTLGVVFTEEQPMGEGGTCPVPHPLKVTNLGSGVSIAPETILNCAETESLARWITEVVVPASQKLLGAPPTRIVQDSAYVCRTRYNDPQQKISEHARANAVDIKSFGFADRKPVDIGVNEAGSPEAKFEAEIRKGSCDYFTTVLGPGSNAAHATHFHLDMAFRRGGYRLCELGGPSTASAPANTKRE